MQGQVSNGWASGPLVPLPETAPSLPPTNPTQQWPLQTCFGWSQIGGPERALETTDSKKGSGKRGSPAHTVLGSVWEEMGLALLVAAQFPRIPTTDRRELPPPSRPPGPRLPAGWRTPRATGLPRYPRGRSEPWPPPRVREPRERSGWGPAGRGGAGWLGGGRQEGRTPPAAATAAAAARPGQAGTPARRARGPRNPAPAM